MVSLRSSKKKEFRGYLELREEKKQKRHRKENDSQQHGSMRSPQEKGGLFLGL